MEVVGSRTVASQIDAESRTTGDELAVAGAAEVILNNTAAASDSRVPDNVDIEAPSKPYPIHLSGPKFDSNPAHRVVQLLTPRIQHSVVSERSGA